MTAGSEDIGADRCLPAAWYRPGWTHANVQNGTLPDRYREPWAGRFEALARPYLVPGAAVLDVGAGCDPTLPFPRQMQLGEYVGLDISGDELDAAPAETYTETVVGDVADYAPTLAGRFDVVLSWQVLEHVRDVDAAVENCRLYLKSGGVFVALLSGANSLIGILNRLTPHRVAVGLNRKLVGRDPTSIFPAYYDKCTADGLQAAFGRWDVAEIEPKFRGAVYFQFSSAALRGYLSFEDRAERRGWTNAATHYFVLAKR